MQHTNPNHCCLKTQYHMANLLINGLKKGGKQGQKATGPHRKAAGIESGAKTEANGKAELYRAGKKRKPSTMGGAQGSLSMFDIARRAEQ